MAQINGTDADDLLVGSEGGDTLVGGAGNDTLDGSAGFTFASYDSSTSAVGVQLFDGNVITDGLGGRDLLINIHGVIGSVYDDFILGSSVTDVLIGIGGNDNIQGLDGDDLLNGNGGDDDIDGGNGTDAVRYSGNRSDYLVTAIAGGFSLADTRTGSDTDGTDTVANVESFEFADGTVSAADLLDGDTGTSPRVSIAAVDTSKAEGNGGATAFTFTISLDTAATTTQTVQWQAAGVGANSATAADFLGGAFPSSTLTFAPGETSKAITVSVAGDTAVEPNEGFRVVLTNPSSGLAFGTATTATASIVNDDVPPSGGTAGDDTLATGAGSDVLDGAAGADTVVFSQMLGAYTVRDLGQRVLVSGPDGNDTLLGVERLQFADGVVNLVDGDPLFDTLGYYRDNLDVFRAGVGAKAHYEANGWREGRNPNASFDTDAYLAANQDVKAAGINPLSHYGQNGWKEGRDPSAGFDTQLYLKFHADVAAAGIDPLLHWLTHGEAEGRKAAPAVGQDIVNGFDATYYKLANPDVANAGVDPLAHFNANGWHEGRNPNAFFDTKAYLAANPDVDAADVNPLNHYGQNGWKEGRDPSSHFSTSAYLSNYGDVAAAQIDPLQHFLSFGIAEGRSGFGDLF